MNKEIPRNEKSGLVRIGSCSSRKKKEEGRGYGEEKERPTIYREK